MNPALSIYITGVGSGILLLFFIAKINQIRQDENAYLRRWIREMGLVFFREHKKKETLRMVRTLQQELESLNADNPNQQETASRILVLYKKLTQIGLCPASNDSNTQDIIRWRKYLNFILPHIEEFGIKQARKETLEWNRRGN